VNWRGTRFDIVIADLGQAMRLAGAGRDTAGSPHARILVLASEDGVADIRRAIEADIHGYLLLGDPLSEFIEAAMTLARGGRYLGRSLAGRVAQSLARESLTSREIGVLQLVVAGESNKAIARRLCIELGTVKTHMNGILRKLDATSRTHAAAIAVSQGLVAERMPVPAAGVSSRVPRAGHSAHPA
jgi:two-component system NarL family response regulator